jgi:hypothetical protein
MPPVIRATRPLPLAVMFLVSFVAMSLRLRRRPRAAGQGAALAMMRAPLRMSPWENPRRGGVVTPGSRHAGARESGPILC